MKKQWLIVGIIITLITVGAIVGTRLAPDIFPVEVGAKAPQFRAVNIDRARDSVTLDTWKGKVVLINVWATWCEPCRVEMPALQRLYQSLDTAEFKLVSVSIDETDPSTVRAFRDEFRLTFPIYQDRSRAIERIYQTTGVPETFVIDRDGLIQKKLIGAHEWDSPADQDLIRRLLARRG
jgi:cytochrome c biogenesis protein CcmG/thiol:disulfide interchange protein DsbE